MPIKAGDRIPTATLYRMTDKGPEGVATDTLFAGRRAVVFGLPGAFTPTCSARHLPGFVERADALRARGIDLVACVSVNDAFVMDAWGKALNTGDRVMMLADGSAELTGKLGLELDRTASGMGIRSQRYAMLVEDGVVRQINIEQPGKFEVSSAESMLALL